MAANWTDLAPEPGPLESGKKWHVFLSYRSTHRGWVLALYDILKGLGYEVFLDQYVLTAATPLAQSLGEGLDSSQAAIMVWSGTYEDSQWCRDEASALHNKQNQGKGFRYVVAKVDDSEIAGLANIKLWVDFSGQPEGPAGTGLLSLLYGLKGEPLPEAAVKLAATVDEEMRDGLLNVKTAREVGAADRLIALAQTDDMAWTGSPMLSCEAADGLIALGRVAEAMAVLDQAEASFPKAVRPKQLRGLALARSGQTAEAQFVLGKLFQAGQIGPETLGIYARTWMDRFNAEGKREYLGKSRDLYLKAFTAFPTNYYAGINAASKSLLAGEAEKAAELAKRVLEVTGETPVADYWQTASIAEAQLLQSRFEDAAATYRAAVDAAPDEVGSHASTRGQAVLLLDKLAATDEHKALVLAAFPGDG